MAQQTFNLTINSASGGMQLLSQSDFTLLGYWSMNNSIGLGTLWEAQGLTHRYVGGNLRLYTMAYQGSGTGYCVNEFALPADFATPITFATQTWSSSTWFGGIGWSIGNGEAQHGLLWDETKQRFFTTCAIDYPDGTQENFSRFLFSHGVNGGSITNQKGWWGLANVQQRLVGGGMCKVPAWFQSQYGTGPYAAGFGGYYSRGNVGPVSEGLSLYAFPDPESFGNNTETMPSKVLANFSSGWDGLPSQAGISCDRGVRESNVNESFDVWTSPNPSDGLGRWTWGDKAWDTGVWITGPNKHGFVILPSFAKGNAWYQNSDLHYDGRYFEMQVFNPHHLGEVANGARQPWAVKPVSRWQCLPDSGATQSQSAGDNIAAATYDSVTGKLYALQAKSIYCWQVNS